MLTPFHANVQRLPFSPPIINNPLSRQTGFNSITQIVPPKVTAKSTTHTAPDLPRAVNFYADYSGCGHWRMIWPELLLNSYAKANVQGGTVMIGDKNFYSGIKTVLV